MRSLILLVDDNLSNLQRLGNLLEDKYKTATVTDGPEALAFVRKKLPDLILLDIMMPGMDGLEVCEKLKADTGTKDIPIIFLTARTDTESIVKGFEIGAADYVTKPFRQSELIARIKTHLELQNARDEQKRLIAELQKSLGEIKTLRGLIPICSFCKKIRNDENYWEQVEVYVGRHTGAQFSHSYCPSCMKKHYPEFYDNIKEKYE